MERGFDREAAVKALHRSDQERAAFIRFAFGVDWDNPELHNIVLNMDSLSVDLAVETVLHVARSEEVQARLLDAMKSLEMMSLGEGSDVNRGRLTT